MYRWIFIGLVVLTSPINAEQSQSVPVLTLDQVIVRVLENNPELKGADYAAMAAAARIRVVQQSPAATMNVGFENFAGSGSFKGSDALEATLSLSKIFELGNKSDLRGEVAQQELLLLNTNQDARRLDILAETTRRFIHVVVDQARLQVISDKLALLQSSYKVVNRRVKAGRSPVAERRRVAISVARAEIELEHAEHELLSSRLKLTTMWGETRTDFSTKADLFTLATVEPFTKFEILLEQNPDLVQFASERRLAQARIHVAQAKQSANIEITGGIRHLSSIDDNAFVLSARIPFGLNSRAAPAIEEQQFMHQQVSYNHEKQRLALYASLYSIHQELLHSYTAADVLQQRIIPEAKQVLREYEKGYAAGRYSFLELSDAQRTLLDARLEAVMTSANYHRYRIEIDRLTGARLSNAHQSTGAKQ